MSLEQKITDDTKQAMKDKNVEKVSTLRLLTAAIKNVRIDKRVDALKDEDVMTVLKKQVKQRQESIEQYGKAGREDLKAKEENELVIIKSYLPEELSEEELAKIVETAINETGASSMKEMGIVMKTVLEKAAGRADNKTVSNLVKQKLS